LEHAGLLETQLAGASLADDRIAGNVLAIAFRIVDVPPLFRLDTGELLRKEPNTGASARSTISPLTASVLAEHLDHFAMAGLDGLRVPPTGLGIR
jgi:hypothetical protein